jgi:hypothetical protein
MAALIGPEYLLRSLPYKIGQGKDEHNGSGAWEFETALAIVEEAVNTLDAANITTAPCEVGNQQQQ